MNNHLISERQTATVLRREAARCRELAQRANQKVVSCLLWGKTWPHWPRWGRRRESLGGCTARPFGWRITRRSWGGTEPRRWRTFLVRNMSVPVTLSWSLLLIEKQTHIDGCIYDISKFEYFTRKSFFSSLKILISSYSIVQFDYYSLIPITWGKSQVSCS